MPIVSKKSIFIDATLRDFMREIKYSSKNGKFSADLPEKVIAHLMLTDKFVIATTEAECEQLFDAKIREYNEAKRETSKVILFRIKLNGFVPPADNPGYHRAEHNKEVFRLYETEIGGFQSLGLGMMLEWGVYEKEFYKEASKYSPISWNVNERLGTGINDYLPKKVGKDVKEIPYTEERQAWFIKLQQSFEEMLIKVKDKLRDLTPAELEQLVDSSSFKLLSA